MSNRYLTGHFALISIILFSLSLSFYGQSFILSQLENFGVYEGMLEFFTEGGIKLAILFLFLLIFFMIFSALKLIADTTIQLSMLFFSKDEDGSELNKVRAGSWIFLGASLLSLLLMQEIFFIVVIFVAACIIYFMFFVYKIYDSLSILSLIGFVFFHVVFWGAFILAVGYTSLRLYNSFIQSIPF
ncbi:DUF5366 family protein [Alkalicoccobacillus murimartini]|uniref:YufK family protein n=1 Tax=Alkalicoccobacillus murimartini TaxID=171685 RepID=A0ABT9YBN6_9BACI|nr:DUF5366 family protein [Alkalicoccobacillus murimartini]MDQ0205252.1 hypothetical protein [Alkalicoccobacillus murimartini]